MPLDFRATQVRVTHIIASASLVGAGTNATNRIVVYNIDADGIPSGQGNINTTKFSTAAIGADTFFYVSGAIGSIGTSTLGTSVFGGDLVVSGNFHVSGNVQVTGSFSGIYPDGLAANITPQMFGALANGTQDNTDAIRAAISAVWATTTGSEGYPLSRLYLPKGRYLVSGALTIGAGNGFQMFGDGPQQTIITLTTGSPTATLDLGGVSNGVFRDFTLTTTGSTSTTLPQLGIYLWSSTSVGSSNVCLTNVAVSGNFVEGIRVGAKGDTGICEQHVITNARVVGGRSATSLSQSLASVWLSAITVGGGSGPDGGTVSHAIYGFEGLLCQYGVYFQRSNANISNARLHNNEVAIGGTPIGNSRINGVHARAGSRLVDFQSGSYFNGPLGIEISDCTFAGWDTYPATSSIGTLTSASNSTLVDGAATWTVNQWAGAVVMLRDGYLDPAANDGVWSSSFASTVTSNNGTTLNLASNLSTSPYYTGVFPSTETTYVITFPATAGTTTTLTDTRQSWTTNQWAGWRLVLLSGPSKGSTSTITSNTATQLTFSPSVPSAVDTNTAYVITLAPDDLAWINLGQPGRYNVRNVSLSGSSYRMATGKPPQIRVATDRQRVQALFQNITVIDANSRMSFVTNDSSSVHIQNFQVLDRTGSVRTTDPLNPSYAYEETLVFRTTNAIKFGPPTFSGRDGATYASAFDTALSRSAVGTLSVLGVSGTTVAVLASGSTTISGALHVSNGISASHTTLFDGTPFLIGGPNITITTQSNGSIAFTGSAGGGGGEVSASYLVLSGTASLANERVFTAGVGIGVVDGGANGTYTVSAALAAGPNITLTTLGNNKIAISGTSFAPLNSAFVTIGNDATLTGERAFTAGAGIGIVDGGANSTFTVSAALAAGPNITLATLGNNQVAISGTTFAPLNSAYITIGNDGTLTGERAIVGGAGIGFTDAGANSTITISASITAGPGAAVATIGTNAIAVTASNTPSASFAWSAAGPSAPLTGSSKVTFNQNTSTMFVTGTVIATGFSGSLTRLADGTSYLIQGGNITITTGANGGITFAVTGTAPLNSTYLTIGNDAVLTNERAFTAGAGIGVVDGGANSTFTVSAALAAGPNITLATLGNNQIAISGTSFAPLNSAFVTIGNDATLTGERAFTAGAGIGVVDGGANSTFTVSAALAAGPNITLATLANNQVAISGTTFAPLASAYITVGNDATLTGERAITGGAGIGFSDGGANSTITISASIAAGPGTAVATIGTNAIAVTSSNTPSGAIAWSSAGPSAPLTGSANFTFDRNTNTVMVSGTVTAMLSFTASQTASATSGQNISSSQVVWRGSYWNGASAVNGDMFFQSVPGDPTGTPGGYLQLTQQGFRTARFLQSSAQIVSSLVMGRGVLNAIAFGCSEGFGNFMEYSDTLAFGKATSVADVGYGGGINPFTFHFKVWSDGGIRIGTTNTDPVIGAGSLYLDSTLYAVAKVLTPIISNSSGLTLNLDNSGGQLQLSSSVFRVVSSTTPGPVYSFFGVDPVGSDKVGGGITMAPGRSTGLATPAALKFQSTFATGTGTTAQTLVDTMMIASGVIHMSSALRVNRVAVAGTASLSNTTASFAALIYGASTTVSTQSILLPQAADFPGQLIIIKDEGGNSVLKNITIARSGTDTIDGQTSDVISSAYGSKIYYNDSNKGWFSVGGGGGSAAISGYVKTDGTTPMTATWNYGAFGLVLGQMATTASAPSALSGAIFIMSNGLASPNTRQQLVIKWPNSTTTVIAESDAF